LGKISKQTKILLIMLAVLIILGLGFIIANKYILPEMEKYSREPLFLIGEGKITDVRLTTNRNDRTKVCRIVQSLEGWVIEGAEDMVLSANDVSVMILKLRSIGLEEVISEPQHLSVYGLDNPSMIELNTDDGRYFKLLIGNKSPMNDGYYGMAEGDGRVCIISDIISGYAVYGARNLIEKQLYPFIPYESFLEIDSVKVISANDDDDIIIEKKPPELANSMSEINSYYITANGRYDMNFSAGDEFFKKVFNNNKAEAVIDYDVNDDVRILAKYGLDTPAYTLEFVRGGSAVVLHFGDKAENYWYMQMEGRDVIYMIKDTFTTFLHENPKNLAERMMILRDMTIVSDLAFTDKNGVTAFEISNKDQITVTSNGEMCDLTAFKSLYQVMVQLRYEDMMEPIDGEPILTIDIAYQYGQPEKFEFIPLADDMLRCFVRINGEGDFFVLRKFVDKFVDDIQNYKEGQPIVSIF